MHAHFSDSTPPATFTYDNAASGANTNNTRGRLTSVSNSNSTTNYTTNYTSYAVP